MLTLHQDGEPPRRTNRSLGWKLKSPLFPRFFMLAIPALLVSVPITDTHAAPTSSVFAAPVSTHPPKTVRGSVTIKAKGDDSTVSRVDFTLRDADGRTVLTHRESSAPFHFMGDDDTGPHGWDTTSHADGLYTLEIVAVNRKGRVFKKTQLPLWVDNQGAGAPDADVTVHVPTVEIVNGLATGQVVAGNVVVDAQVIGGQADEVLFIVNNDANESASFTHLERKAPYVLNGDRNGRPNGWDTTTLPDGNYTLAIEVRDDGQTTDIHEIAFVIDNVPDDTPAGTTAPTITRVLGIDPTGLSGQVTLQAQTTGDIGSVVFELMRGSSTLKTHTESRAPYYFLGDSGGSKNLPHGWNTQKLANGNYTLRVTAFDRAGAAGSPTQINLKINNPVVPIATASPTPAPAPTTVTTTSTPGTPTPPPPPPNPPPGGRRVLYVGLNFCKTIYI